MINTGDIIMKAYGAALAGIGTPIYFVAPNTASYPYVLLDNIAERGGEDVPTRTKENRNASEVDVTLKIVTGVESGGGAKEVDAIASLILAIVLPTDIANDLDFTPVKNVVTSLDSSSYDREWNDTHLVITKQITINHLISQQ